MGVGIEVTAEGRGASERDMGVMACGWWCIGRGCIVRA